MYMYILNLQQTPLADQSLLDIGKKREEKNAR